MAIIRNGLNRPNAETLFGTDFVQQTSKEKKATSGKELVKEYQIKDFPVDIVDFAQKLGIEIKYENLENDVSGKISIKEGHYTITVEARHSPNRQRFTIAHEIAHYFLHKNLKENFEDVVFFRGGDTNSIEFQANLFAGEILMPEEEFFKQIKSGKSKIEDLAEYFGVSTLAIRVRAKQLNLQGHGL